ncbi:uncharacterized protein LOC135398076 isoform X1 [Ornithodoros turicata]|uniref:uncharacterized protein LOC135398076 isoform X1 n=1 Tax=Ornithodoros turicata TaxID=34597 RepID=UPI00313A303B
MIRFSSTIRFLCFLSSCTARQFPDFRSAEDTDTYQDQTDFSNYPATIPEYPSLSGSKLHVNPDIEKFGYGISCKSDEECASGLGLACVARRTALHSRCDCARGTPIFIRDTDGVAKCVRGKHLYESCASDLECAHHDKNMKCVDFLCYCPQPYVLTDNQKCLPRKSSLASALFSTLPTLALLLTLLFIGAAYSYRRLSRATKEKQSCAGPTDTMDTSTDLDWRPNTGSSVSSTLHRPRTPSAFQSSVDPRQRYNYGEHASWGYARIPKHPPRYIRCSKGNQVNKEASNTFLSDDCSTLLEKKTCIAPIHRGPTTPLARSVDDASTRSSPRSKQRRTSHRKINRGRSPNQDGSAASKLPSSSHIPYPEELKDLLVARGVVVNVEPIKPVIAAGQTAFMSQEAELEDSCVNREREIIQSSTKDPSIFSGSIRHNKTTSRATGITIQTPPPQEPGHNDAVSEECVPTDRSTSQKLPSLIVTYRDLKHYFSTTPFGTSPNTKSSYGESSGMNSYPSKPSDVSVSWTSPPGSCCQVRSVDVASSQPDAIGGPNVMLGKTGKEHATNMSAGEAEIEGMHGGQYQLGRTEQKRNEQLQLTITIRDSRRISQPSLLPPSNVANNHPTVLDTSLASEQTLQPSEIELPHSESEPSSPNLTTEMYGTNIHLIDNFLIPSCLPDDVFSPENCGKTVAADSCTTPTDLMSSGFDFVSLDINQASTEELLFSPLSTSDNAGFEQCSARDDCAFEEWRNTPSRRARRSTTELSPSPQCQSNATTTVEDALSPATKYSQLFSNEIAIHQRRINEAKRAGSLEALLQSRAAMTLRPIAIGALPPFIVRESSARDAYNTETGEGSSMEEMRISSVSSSRDSDDPLKLAAMSVVSSRSESDVNPDIEFGKPYTSMSSDAWRSVERHGRNIGVRLHQSSNMIEETNTSTSNEEQEIPVKGSICAVHTQTRTTLSGHRTTQQQGWSSGHVSQRALRAPFMKLLALGNRHYYRERRNLSPVQSPSILDETLYILHKMRRSDSTPRFYAPYSYFAMHDVEDTVQPLSLQNLILRQHPVLRAIMDLHRGQCVLEDTETRFSSLGQADCLELLAPDRLSVTGTEPAQHATGRKSLDVGKPLTPEKVNLRRIVCSHTGPCSCTEPAATQQSDPTGISDGGTVAVVPIPSPDDRVLRELHRETPRSGLPNAAGRRVSVLEEPCFESLYNAVLLSQSRAARSETQKRSIPDSPEQKRVRRVSFPTELISTPVASTSQEARVSYSDSGVSKTIPYNHHRQQEPRSTFHEQLLSFGLRSPEDHHCDSITLTQSPMEQVRTLSNSAKTASCPPQSMEHKRSLPICRTVSRRSVSFKDTLSDSALRRGRTSETTVQHSHNDKPTDNADDQP